LESASTLYLDENPNYTITLLGQSQFNHKGDKIVFCVSYRITLSTPPIPQITFEYYSEYSILDFDKNSCKFGISKLVHLSKLDPFLSTPNDSFNFNMAHAHFSLNDRYLYFISAERRFEENMLKLNPNSNTFHTDYVTNVLVQLDMEEIGTKPKIIFREKFLIGLKQNHKGEIFFNHEIRDYENDTTERKLNKILYPNNVFPQCNVQFDMLPPEKNIKSEKAGSYLSDFMSISTTHIFDFLRIEQQTAYSCSATVQLKNTSLSDIGFNKYKWHIRDENDSLLVFEQFEPPALSYTQNGNYAVQLFAQSPKGGGYGEWYIDTIRVRIPAKPVARFSASATIICQHLPVAFTNLSTDQQTHTPKPKSWLWDFGDGSTSTQQNPMHTYTQPGVYTVSLLFQNGYCDSLLVKTNYIHVIDAPKPGFEVSDTQGCTPFTLTITDTTWFRVQSKEYFISDTGAWLPMTQNQLSYTFRKAGIFKVVQKLTGTSGCVIVTDSVWVSVAKGITPQDTFSIRLADIQAPYTHIQWKSHPAAVRYLLYSGESLQTMSLLAVTTDTFFKHSIQSAQYYTVIAQDSCGNKGTVGNYAKPVWLKGTIRGNNEAAELSHTPYEIWAGTEKQYEIQKFVNGSWQSLRSSNNVVPFSDENFIVEDSLQSCYRVRIIDLSETSLVSHSNVLCLDYLPALYIPNAFSPNGDGVNDLFDIATTGIASYKIKIYNRWGQQLFEGENQAWDGTFQGQPSPTGIYMLHLLYTTKDGKKFETGNTIQLIR
jgi:gliding motility-associated-like protein